MPTGAGAASAVEAVSLQASFFSLRTPLLPFDELERWGAGLEAPGAAEPDLEEAVAADRLRLRSRLAGLLARPELCEALWLASPSLFRALDRWRRDPDSRRGRRAEQAVVRYLLRMAARPTPFGLLAGSSTGTVGGATRLELGPRAAYRRLTSIDLAVVGPLAAAWAQHPAGRRQRVFHPNDSLYRAGGKLRYYETQVVAGVRGHHLAQLEPTGYLEATLERARGGASLAELARSLVESDPDGEIETSDAEAFVDELVEAQVLVPEGASPPLTGPEPLDGLAAHGRRFAPAAEAERLERALAARAAIDERGVGAPLEAYHRLGAELGFPPGREPPGLFQVDLVKPGSLTLGAAVLVEIERALAMVDRLPRPPDKPLLGQFRAAFLERYGEGVEVPLAVALDEGSGVGPLVGGETAVPAHMIEREPPPAWLLARLEESLASGLRPIDLAAGELPDPTSSLPPLPVAFDVVATLAASSGHDVDRGRFELLFRGCTGPGGGRLLARLAHADPELRRRLVEHLAAEEASDPEAVHAEVVHLPERRPGNIVARPRLRRYEIPYLARGAAEGGDVLPVSDLVVTVREGRVVLRSRRLGRRVVPRLTTAHFHGGSRQAVYRFLGALESDGMLGGWSWTWGKLSSRPALPRVRSGRLILSLARWQVPPAELEPLAAARGGRRTAAVRRWRESRRLPRWVSFDDGWTELPVDLDNVLAVDAFLSAARRLARAGRPALLRELFPDPERLCVRGPEGRFVHEIVLPVVRGGAAARPVGSR